ncbi:hypothetical protein RchiOBHm_Chr4g0396111 [Rosa chinensis]|uniref:Small acidic protein n=1 Tax=Rosa chinensis TaxID=74649 RepID=A0A2P6QRS2_ROSCH|nr:small acidic protein 1 [Rosa chinensis]PRQ36848.1 hypothetical protein RchiOBHm_Chr4g0396111 [Rosa chinensis]
MSSFTRQKASSPAEIQYARRSAALASARQRRSTAATMRPTAMEFFSDMDDQGSTMAMDVDDIDALEIFGGDGVIGENKLADLDFFNSFPDDFDESDMIN